MKKLRSIILLLLITCLNFPIYSNIENEIKEQSAPKSESVTKKKKNRKKRKAVRTLNQSSRTQLPFTIIIYAYNDAAWIQQSLESAITQSYQNYSIILIDDASSDDTLTLAHKFIQKNGLQNTKVDHHKAHLGKLASLYNAIQTCPDNNIILLLNAHDWLINEWTLTNINQQYIKHDAWMTFGSCTSYPQECNIGMRNGSIPQEIHETKAYRKIFPYMPAVSFFSWLFKYINKNDLIDPTTKQFYQEACECYIIWPLAEMAHTHCKGIDDYTYVVNTSDPLEKLIEDYHLRIACNSQMGKELPVYQPII